MVVCCRKFAVNLFRPILVSVMRIVKYNTSGTEPCGAPGMIRAHADATRVSATLSVLRHCHCYHVTFTYQFIISRSLSDCLNAFIHTFQWFSYIIRQANVTIKCIRLIKQHVMLISPLGVAHHGMVLCHYQFRLFMFWKIMLAMDAKLMETQLPAVFCRPP